MFYSVDNVTSKIRRDKIENKLSKTCILTQAETIWNCIDSFKNKDGRYLKWCINCYGIWNDLNLQRTLNENSSAGNGAFMCGIWYDMELQRKY